MFGMLRRAVGAFVWVGFVGTAVAEEPKPTCTQQLGLTLPDCSVQCGDDGAAPTLAHCGVAELATNLASFEQDVRAGAAAGDTARKSISELEKALAAAQAAQKAADAMPRSTSTQRTASDTAKAKAADALTTAQNSLSAAKQALADRERALASAGDSVYGPALTTLELAVAATEARVAAAATARQVVDLRETSVECGEGEVSTECQAVRERASIDAREEARRALIASHEVLALVEGIEDELKRVLERSKLTALAHIVQPPPGVAPRLTHARARLDELRRTLGQVPYTWAESCMPTVVLNLRGPSDISPSLEHIERWEQLRDLRPWLSVKNEKCTLDDQAKVELQVLPQTSIVRTAESKDAAKATRVTHLQEPASAGTTLPFRQKHGRTYAPGSLSLLDILVTADPTGVQELLTSDDDDVMEFNVTLRWRWCVSADGGTMVACSPHGEVSEQQGSYKLVVAKRHETVSLSLVTQPGRFLFTSQPCTGAVGQTQGEVPLACRDGLAGAWSSVVGGSALGLKVYVAPSVKFPWLGMSFGLSTASVALSRELQLPAEQAADAPALSRTSQLYFSPADLSFQPIDFRLPKPVRIDIGLTIGGGLVLDGRAIRWAPLYGISFATPLVDVFGKRFGNGADAYIVDHRANDAADVELHTQIVELESLRRKLEEKELALLRAKEGEEVDCKEDFKVFEHRLTRATEIRAGMTEVPAEEQSFLALDRWWSRAEANLKKCAPDDAKKPDDASTRADTAADAIANPPDNK